MKKIICLGFILQAIFIKQSIAQEFGIELSGGLQGIQQITGADRKLKAGGNFGLNYTIPFSKHWGLLAGIHGSMYQSQLKLTNGQYSSYEVDSEGSAFQYNVSTTQFREDHRTYALNVPLMLQYQTTGKTQWYVNAGGKFFIPLNTAVKASADQLITSGYYPDNNFEIFDLPQHGFGTADNWRDETDIKLKHALFLSAATGISFKLSDHLRLYTGVYVDYGITDVKNGDRQRGIVAYSPSGTTAIKANSMIHTPQVSDVKLAGYGIHVRLNFGKKQKSPVPAPPAPEPAPKIPFKDTIKAAPVQETPVIKTPEPAPQPSAAELNTIGQPVAFGAIGQTEVPEALKQHLDSVAAILLQYRDLQIELTGHTCDIGSDETNQRVGEARARATAAYLEGKGVAADRMRVHSAGDSQPLLPNSNEANRCANRRVAVIVIR